MLDHSIEILRLHPSIMSIGRKWVSDTNLSKLLHETIEKKQANKQSKLPDFCKDAILSATIKKISSAMLISRKLSRSDSSDDFSQCSDNGLGEDALSCDDLLDKTWDDELDTPMNLDSVEPEDMDSDMLSMSVCKSNTKWRTIRPSLERQSSCSSPKRKRQPSSEGMEDCASYTNLETVAPHSSPRKKRKENFCNSKTLDPTTDYSTDCTDSNIWLSNDIGTTDSHCVTQENNMYGQRSKSLPHLTFLTKEDLILPAKSDYTPSKSVVNSISELSIHDCLEPDKERSWCFPNSESSNSDPLELNGFFQELKTVTVNPN